MIVGLMQIEIRIEDSFTLKDKRRVLKSLIERTKRNFNVSIAEVDNNEIVNFATLGLSTVSNSTRFIDEVFDKILGFLEINFNIEIVKAKRELI